MSIPMSLALSADLPLVWESPDVLRIGVTRPVARLAGLTPSEQRFLSLLAAGVSADRLADVTKRCGLSPAERETLLGRISEALGPPPPISWARPAPPMRVCVAAGEGLVDPAWARVFAGALGATGPICSIAMNPNVVVDADLLVLPERYAAPRSRVAAWLSLDIPTLSIRLRDRSVLLGPIIGRSGAPCLDCCNRAEMSRDPEWAVVTAQVSGTLPPSETSSMALSLAAHAAGLLDERSRVRAGAPNASLDDVFSNDDWRHPGAQLELPVHLGVPRHGGKHRRVVRRLECACVTLEALAPATRNESGYTAAGAPIPTAAKKREGVRLARPPAAEPESRSSSRARVSAT